MASGAQEPTFPERLAVSPRRECGQRPDGDVGRGSEESVVIPVGTGRGDGCFASAALPGKTTFRRQVNYRPKSGGSQIIADDDLTPK